MAEQDNKPQKMKNGKARGGRPLRSSLTALAIGLGWAALHMPAIRGLDPALVVWIVDALIASLIAKAALDLGLALIGWLGRTMISLGSGG